MFTQIARTAFVALGLTVATLATAQAPSTQPADLGASEKTVQQAVDKMGEITTAIDQTLAVMENARESYDPAKLRAALDQSQKNLKVVQRHMADCTAMMQSMQPADNDKPHEMKHDKKHDMHKDNSGGMHHDAKSEPAAQEHQHADVQAVDPVCGMKVDTAKGLHATHAGKTYYFCSADDKAKFEAHPENYVKEK